MTLNKSFVSILSLIELLFFERRIENDFKKKIQKVCALLERVTGGIVMGKKTKKKDEIVIINKFKEESSEDVRVSISKIFEMFCSMQLTKK